MPLHPLWITPIIAVLAAGLVFADANRRNLTRRARLLWTAGVGLASISVFVGVYLFQTYAYELYYRVTGQYVVAQTPYELVLNHVFGISSSTNH